MSLESDLHQQVNELAFGDEAAAEVVHRFLQIMNSDDKFQSASSMILNLGKALVEIEDEHTEAEPEINTKGN